MHSQLYFWKRSNPRRKIQIALFAILGILIIVALVFFQKKFGIFAEGSRQVSNTATLFYDENGQVKGVNSNTVITSIVTPTPTPTATPRTTPTPTPQTTPTPQLTPTPSTDTSAPTVNITSPNDGAKLKGSKTNIKITSSDNVGVTRVEIYIDNAKAYTGYTAIFNYSWSTRNIASGNHTIYAKAFDAAGNIGTTSTITVTK